MTECAKCNRITFLSPNVRKLVCDAAITDEEYLKGETMSPDDSYSYTHAQSLFTSEGFIDDITRLLPCPKEGTLPTASYFHDAVSILAPVFQECEKQLSTLSAADFSDRYSQYFTWTGNQQIFLESFSLLERDSLTNSIIVLLLLSSALEQSLGDLYLLRGQHCPHHFKDLLTTPELSAVIGQSFCDIIQVLFGPPISLNLRNLVWHGFACPGEIQPRFAYFTLLLAASIGRHLIDTSTTDPILHRPSAVLGETCTIHRNIKGLPDSVLSLCDADTFAATFSSSTFIVTSHLPLWHQALSFHKLGKYGHCVSLVLPLLEHALRHVFTSVNLFPERILTAESSVFYITLDEMLSRKLPNGGPNQLLQMLPVYLTSGVHLEASLASFYLWSCVGYISATHSSTLNKQDVLCDLLMYADGPRIRDRLSHGESRNGDVTNVHSETVLFTTVSLASFFMPLDQQTGSVGGVLSRVCLYTSLFHPVARLTSQIAEIAEGVALWPGLFHVTPQLNISEEDHCWQAWCDISPRYESVCHLALQLADSLSLRSSLTLPDAIASFHCHSRECCNPVSLFSKLSAATLSDIHLENLPRSCWDHVYHCEDGVSDHSCPSQDHTLHLLQQISVQCCLFSRNVVCALTTRHDQLKGRQLRSRQRDTLRRMLSGVPVLATVTWVTLSYVVATTHSTLQSGNVTVQLLTIRLMKSLLQLYQNLVRYTQLDKNKWEECVMLSETYMTNLISYVSTFT